MNDAVRRSLLPDGLRDALPPDAAHECAIVDRLVASFAACGYERVDPPLVEFEDNLFHGAGQAIAPHTFRLMDPVSQRMMGVRADMTMPVARIATTRLANAARPLRLAYAGPVLLVKGSQLRPERQFTQAGAELIGSDSPLADAEVIRLAAGALAAAGASGLSVDISLPTLVREVCAAHSFDDDRMGAVRAAMERKDAAALPREPAAAHDLLQGLLAAAGPVETALERLSGLALPPAALRERSRLEAVVARLSAETPDLPMTVDPTEYRGFEYQSGLSFTFFARGVRGELARGGRYSAGDADEPATGFSIFLDSVLRAVPGPAPAERVYVPVEAAHSDGDRLRQAGHITVAGFETVGDVAAEARRLGCSHVFRDGKVEPVGSAGNS